MSEAKRKEAVAAALDRIVTRLTFAPPEAWELSKQVIEETLWNMASFLLPEGEPEDPEEYDEIQLNHFEANVWDVIVAQFIENGGPYAFALEMADTFIQDRRKRLMKTDAEQRMVSAEPGLGTTAFYAKPDDDAVPSSAEGRGHLQVIKGGEPEDADPEWHKFFLVCEDEEGGLMDFIGNPEEVFDYFRTHRHRVEGEEGTFVRWAGHAEIGDILKFSKGLVVRVRESGE